MATKWLIGGQHIQYGYAGQRDNSQDRGDGVKYYHTTQNNRQLETYELFSLEFIIWYVQQQLTMESETAVKRGLPCLN